MEYSSDPGATLAVHHHDKYTGGLTDRVLERYEDDGDIYTLPERDPDGEYWDVDEEIEGEHMDNVKGFLSPEDAEEIVTSYDTIRLTGAFFDECVRNTFTSLYEAYRTSEKVEDDVTVQIVADGVVWQHFNDHKYTLEDMVDAGGEKRAISIMSQYADAMATGEEDEDHVYETTQRTMAALGDAGPAEALDELERFATELGDPEAGFGLELVQDI